MLDQLVGGGVVADGDHQLAQGAHIRRHVTGEERQGTADRHLVGLGNSQLFIQGHATSGTFRHDMHVQRQLDHAGCAKDFIFADTVFIAVHQIQVVEARMAGQMVHFIADRVKDAHGVLIHVDPSCCYHSRCNPGVQSSLIVFSMHFAVR